MPVFAACKARNSLPVGWCCTTSGPLLRVLQQGSVPGGRGGRVGRLWFPWASLCCCIGMGAICASARGLSCGVFDLQATDSDWQHGC